MNWIKTFFFAFFFKHHWVTSSNCCFAALYSSVEDKSSALAWERLSFTLDSSEQNWKSYHHCFQVCISIVQSSLAVWNHVLWFHQHLFLTSQGSHQNDTHAMNTFTCLRMSYSSTPSVSFIFFTLFSWATASLSYTSFSFANLHQQHHICCDTQIKNLFNTPVFILRSLILGSTWEDIFELAWQAAPLT